MEGSEQEHEVRFNASTGHNHDGINSAPVSSGPQGGLSGLTILAQTITQILIGPGLAVDVVTGGIIEVSAPLPVDVAGAVGPGGVDTLGVTRPGGGAAVWHNIYLIRNPRTGVVDAVFSDQSPAPDLSDPSFDGYTQYRLVGVWRDLFDPVGAQDLLMNGKVTGEGAQRTFWFEDDPCLGGGGGAPANVVGLPALPLLPGAQFPLIDLDGSPLVPGLSSHEIVDITWVDVGAGGGFIEDGDYVPKLGWPPTGSRIYAPTPAPGASYRGTAIAIGGMLWGHDNGSGAPSQLVVNSITFSC